MTTWQNPLNGPICSESCSAGCLLDHRRVVKKAQLLQANEHGRYDRPTGAEYNCTHKAVTFTTTQQSMTRLLAGAADCAASQDDSPSLGAWDILRSSHDQTKRLHPGRTARLRSRRTIRPR